MNRYGRFAAVLASATVATLLMLPAQALAAASASGGSCGTTLNVSYGGGGGVGTLAGFTAGPFGTLAGADLNAATDVSFDCATRTEDGHLVTAYTIENTAASGDLAASFIALADGDDGDYFATDDIPTHMSFPAGVPASEPDAWEIDGFFGDINTHAGSGGSGSLDNMNQCGDACGDAVMALQWDLLVPAGMRATVGITLADDGFAASQRFLALTAADGNGDAVGPELTLSGQAVVVPLPAPVLLLGGALAMLAPPASRASRRHGAVR